MSRVARRGVLMTASSKRPPRPSWRDELPEEDDVAADEDGGTARKASQREWAALELEVQEERRRKHAAENFASGRRDTVVAYDDVVGEEEAEADRPPHESNGRGKPAPDAPLQGGARNGAAGREDGAAPSASPAPAPSPGSPVEEGPSLPEGVITAGQDSRAKKRGGTKKTGSQKRKQARGDKEEKDDEERWLKLRLAGEKKPKRIDATRIVYYHDFDRGDAMAEDVRPQGGTEEGATAPAPGNFRAQLQGNLFEDEEDEDDA
mmetsp:Transcript_111310/g.315100  ORF Transcript_111310/g.315100 Transcript_111310/m.315100 type:complete len:263 (-) Transcript_111310:167-955(-)